MTDPYKCLRPLLFRLPPEAAHGLSLGALRLAHRAGLLPGAGRGDAPVSCMGLQFANRLGLAAGMDKDGDSAAALAALGFGFVEVGTITPAPQSGNPAPRLFRLPRARALINRMGFNNCGLAALQLNLRRGPRDFVLGINIGKGRDTPLEDAAADYLQCLDGCWTLADYLVLNLSSPNTAGLRLLQQRRHLDPLLAAVQRRAELLGDRHGKAVPVLIKASPDLDDDGLGALADSLMEHRLQGVVATNSTLGRAGLEGLRHSAEVGGLSGAPLHCRALEVVRQLRSRLGQQATIIGVGGVMSAADAAGFVAAGADLVQLYSGLIYNGPRLINQCIGRLQGRQSCT